MFAGLFGDASCFFSTSSNHTGTESSPVDLIKNLQHSKSPIKKFQNRFCIQRRQTFPSTPYPVKGIMNLSRHFCHEIPSSSSEITHPYLLADRIEDRTPRELIRAFFKKANCDCTVWLCTRNQSLVGKYKSSHPGVLMIWILTLLLF